MCKQEKSAADNQWISSAAKLESSSCGCSACGCGRKDKSEKENKSGSTSK